jgi:ATP-dependent RNA helicase DHX57
MEATRESEGTVSTFPSGANTPLPALEAGPIAQQLKSMGFRPAHVDSCMKALVAAHERLHAGPSAQSGSSRMTQDPLTLSLNLLSPLEAAIEWLLVHLPEDDLPPSYRSSAAVDFVSSVSSGMGGQTELVKGWVIDKLTRKAGFPRKAVMRVIEEETRESVVLDLLGRRLCGWESDEGGWGVEEYGAGWEAGDEQEDEARRIAREEEMVILTSVLDDRVQQVSEQEIAIEVSAVQGEDLVLNVIFSEASPYPSARYPTHPPTFYLTSHSLPSYFRLHLHGEVLRAFRDPERPDLQSLLEAGAGGAVYAMMEILETALPACLKRPPDIASVTQYLVPKVEDVQQEVEVRKRLQKLKVGRGRGRQPGMSEQEVRAHHDAMQAAPGWKAMLAARQSLPAWSSREEIITALEENRVVVIVGETGSGKSTQSPSYILDHEIAQGRGASTNIFVTQPRRVAAIGVATRVAEERMEDLDKGPQTVGYVIRGESRTNAKMAKITFCTTGVVLRRLASGGDVNLEGVSHIIVDEVHERSVDGDFLLLQLRELLKRNRTIKVSAGLRCLKQMCELTWPVS